MASIVTVKLNKNAGSSWGFRLQGGKDFATPLCIQKVNGGSVAEQAGLQAGDAIVSIGGRDALTLRHKEAQDAIVSAGNNFDIVVQRGSQIWKPHVTALPEAKIIADGVPVVTKTSLAANQKLVNTQYNSPVNIYSEDSIAETLSAQAEVLGKGVIGINFKKYAKEEKIRTDSPTYKLLHGEEEPQRKPRPPSQNLQDSAPFQRDVTQEQKGYYSISDRLYCDVHAKQAARSNPPAPNFEPITVQPGALPPVGAVTAPQASRMKVPSAFQHGGPAPVPIPAPAPAPVPAPQPEVPQPVFQEVPEPLPEPVFEPTQVPLAVPEVASQPSSQIIEEEEEEGLKSPPLLNGGTTEEEALLPPQDTSDHVTGERHIPEGEIKPIENGYVEEIEKPISASVDEAENLLQNGEPVEVKDDVRDEIETTEKLEPIEPVAETAPTKSELESLPASAVEPTLEPTPELVPEPASVQILPEPGTVSSQIQAEPEPAALKTEPAAPAQPPFNPPEPFSLLNASESRPLSKPIFENAGSLPGTDATFSNVSHFHAEESRFTETKLSSSSVFQTSLGIEAVTQRAPAPAPAPIKPFAPAPAPAPAPVVAAPMKPAPAPAYSTSANPQGFGAPAGDINVRSHIPKKGQSFEWPPSRTVQVVEEESHPPAWAPAGEIPSVRRPVKTTGPLPKRPPLLPTPPPPKDYDVIVMKSLSSSQIQTVQQQTIQQTVKQTVQKSSQQTVQQTVQQSSQSRSILAPIPIPQQLPPPSAASRFPNPAPALINIASSVAPTSTVPKAAPAPSSKRISNKASSNAPLSNIASKPTSGGGIRATKKPSISPPKVVPVTVPMPSVKFDSVPMPKLSDSPKPVLPQPSPIPISSKPKQKQQQQPIIAGFKSVSAPTHKSSPKPSGGYKPVKAPELAPIIPSVTSSLPASAPALSESVAPKPVPSNPPAPAGDVPAPMIFAPIPAPVPVPIPAPNPISSFGTNTMPKPLPPPGLGGKIGPGGPPAKGVPQAPGHRSAPRRGKGVMNQASASRIPVCNACQRQIRGPFVSALGKTWCPDHFICATSTCKRNIIDMGFVEEQGLLYCENCYESYLAPICGKCDKRIKGDCLNAVGKQFHPECFCCAYCGKVFGSGAFYLEDGLPYCETDWNDLFTTKCVGCNFPIEAGDRWVEALNNNYHSQCFKCSKCHKNLEGQSFFAKGGKPYCKAHAQRGF